MENLSGKRDLPSTEYGKLNFVFVCFWNDGLHILRILLNDIRRLLAHILHEECNNLRG